MSNEPLEIEYKFLIRFPDLERMSREHGYKAEELCQIYLALPVAEGGFQNCRIRRIKSDEGTRYIKTFKQDVTDMTRVEVEQEISEKEWQELSIFRNPTRFPLKKTRHSFKWQGFTYEVDIFPFWSDRAYLEVEVQSEDTKPPIPDFIEVIKDITKDKRYRNSALCQSVILEPLS
ncbi:MAG: CYTH domain-containing protein [Ruminococcus sp.]